MGKKSRSSRKSSGMVKVARANRERRALESKKRRWARYYVEIKAGNRPSPKRHNRWDSAGIDKRLTQLAVIIKAGSTTDRRAYS